MPFAYYDTLSKRERAIYDASDVVAQVRLPYPMDCGQGIDALTEALVREDRKAVEKACRLVSDSILEQLGVSKVRVRVLARRPSDDEDEWLGLEETFHTEGFYERETSLFRQFVRGTRAGR